MKIIKIILIALIPIIVIVGGLYLASNIKKKNIIKEAIESIDNPYYQELAARCQDACCIASVYDMAEINALLESDEKCIKRKVDSLKCPTSYKWCVPDVQVTSPIE